MPRPPLPCSARRSERGSSPSDADATSPGEQCRRGESTRMSFEEQIDGEVGNKKVYDPRSYLKKAEEAMAARMVEACNDLESTGKTIFGNV